MCNALWIAERFAGPREATDPARLATIKTPTLIIWGADDRLIPVSAGRWLAKYIPDSTFTVYPATGHLPMEERPQRSAAEVKAFLAEHP